MSNPLEDLATIQGRWSATANALKAQYEKVRSIALVLTVLAALLAALSTQLNGSSRTALSMTAAACMALVTLVTARFLDASHSSAWVRARAASEALKREGYRYAAKASPYDGATRDAALNQERDRIEKDVDDLIALMRPSGSSSVPTADIAPQEYIDKRASRQRQWLEGKALEAQARARTLRGVEFGLAALTTIITASIGALPKDRLGFDVAAFTGVLTTISGAVVAYVEASRYDFIVSTYRATARRLEVEIRNSPKDPQPGTEDWSAFVNRCEAVLQQENTGWIAKFSRPAA